MQPVLDIFIFLAHNTAVAFVVFGAVWWLGPGRTSTGAMPTASIRRAAMIASGLTLGTFTMIAIWYVTQEGFAGEVESVVSSLSWQVQQGQPLYTTFDQAERYSVLYGPSVFLTNGLFLEILGPSLVSAKIASAAAALGSLVFLYAALRRRRRDLLALSVTALAALYYWAQSFSVYLVRPDALLVFAVAFGLFAAARTRRVLAIVAVGVMAGFVANLKIHSVLYFLPVVAVLARRRGMTAAIWSASIAAVVAAAPFVLYPQISAVNYFNWLANETQHGFRFDLLIQPMGYTAFLALPILLLAWLRGIRFGYLGEEKYLVLSLIPAVVITLVLSAKPGSGIVHLMPLVPSTLYLTGRLARPLADAGLPVWNRPLARTAVMAMILTAMLAGSVNQYRAVRLFDWRMNQMPGVVDDVKQIIDSYNDLTMAMAVGGEDRWYRATWLKPLLVFNGNPVLFDPISLMDTTKSGLPLAAATYDAITEGKVELWLVPKAQVPFRKMSWYDPDTPIFPPEFEAHFQAHYTLGAQTRYFDLWFWNGIEPPAVSLSE